MIKKRIYKALLSFRNFLATEIYTDGSSKNGVGSWAYIIKRGRNLQELSGRVKKAGSNTMEFHAAIEALCAIPEKSKATLYSDSRILIDAMSLGKIPRAHEGQVNTLNCLLKTRQIKWKWVKAHNGNNLNERCDELCLQARENI